MKRLMTITILLTYFFSISAMNLALRQSVRSPRLSHKKGPSYYSTQVNNRKQTISQIMRENKQSMLNNIASVGNIISAGLTSYPLLLLPIASQQLEETVNYSHQQIALQRNDSQAMRDFDLFIKTKPYILDDMKRIKVINEKIETLQGSYQSTNQQLIDENATLYAQQYKIDINELEKQKKCYEQGVITAMTSFFTTYASLDISHFLEDNKKQLERLQNLSYYARGSRLCSLPLAALPLMFRDASNYAESKNPFDAFAASLPVSLCTIPYLALMMLPVEGMPLSVQVSYWVSLLLSTKAAYNNTNASSTLRNKICDQVTNLEHAIKILEIQQELHLQKTRSK